MLGKSPCSVTAQRRGADCEQCLEFRSRVGGDAGQVPEHSEGSGKVPERALMYSKVSFNIVFEKVLEKGPG